MLFQKNPPLNLNPNPCMVGKVHARACAGGIEIAINALRKTYVTYD
jgi:hypothetical protein